MIDNSVRIRDDNTIILRDIKYLFQPFYSPMNSCVQRQFIEYLQADLAVPEDAIDLALRRQGPSQEPLHIVLWQHGLINIEQLDKAFEWQVNQTVYCSTSNP